MKRSYGLIGLLLVAAAFRAHAASPPSQAVSLNQQVVSRGEMLTVSIINPPPSAQRVQVSLSREGRSTPLEAAQYMPPDKDHSVGVVSAQLTPAAQENASEIAAPELALGTYTVSVELDERPFPVAQRLKIVPLGNPAPQLNEFSPASTDQTQSAYFSDTVNTTSKRAVATPVVSLVLRGSGFQIGAQATDNHVAINRVSQELQWGDCAKADLGTPLNAVPRRVMAQAASPKELRLCRVPVPTGGEIQVQFGFGDDLSDPESFRVFSLGRTAVTFLSAVVALVLALLPLGLLSFLPRSYTIEDQSYKLRLLFLDSETDTYSLNKLQFYLWTVAALFCYAYLFISRVVVQHAAWPDVPANLPGIIAVAAGTSVASQFITVSKGSKGAGPAMPGFADLITSGGVVAPDRVQMLLWTLFGVGAFMVSVLGLYPGTLTEAEFPAIPDRLLYLMGLSSTGYLGGKLARKAGPVINEIDLIPPDPDDAVVSSASQSSTVVGPDFVTAINSARLGRDALATPVNPSALAAVAALSNAIVAARAAQTPADFDSLSGTLAQMRATAETSAAEAAQSYAANSGAPAGTVAAQDAAIAQSAAALLQDLSADITSAIAVGAAAAMQEAIGPSVITRTITLRGTNLSAEALLEVDHVELPFRMLLSAEGKQQPDVLVREDGGSPLARVLRFTIDPVRLVGADLVQFHKWFETSGTHSITLTNPDGQMAELGFSLPPGAAQKSGSGS